MSERHIIVIASEIDIVMARLRVRRFAQMQGLETKDQANISLVVSALAHILELDGVERGRVILDSVTEGERIGVRVVCVREYGMVEGLPEKLKDVRWMADRLIIEELSPTGVQITVVKWGSQGSEVGSSTSQAPLEFIRARGG
jgi:hypothetical protein